MKTPQNDKTPYELIARHFSNEASENEIKDVELWKLASSENEDIFKQLQKVWEKTGEINPTESINLDEEWNSFLKAVKQNHNELSISRRSAWAPLYKLASIILIGLFLGFGAYIVNDKIKFEKVVADTDVQLINLPDGSKVFLNRESVIKFPKSYAKSRSISLDGEAFFEVNPDSTKAFVVKSGNLRVEVLGTSFNVKAFKKDERINVIVETGKVAVYEKANSDEKAILVRGDRISYSKSSGESKLLKNQDANYRSWQTGILSFENSSLEEVLNKLTEIYGAEFKLVNKDLTHCRISVKFDHSDLNYILNTLSLTLEIKFENKSSYFLVSGEGC